MKKALWWILGGLWLPVELVAIFGFNKVTNVGAFIYKKLHEEKIKENESGFSDVNDDINSYH